MLLIIHASLSMYEYSHISTLSAQMASESHCLVTSCRMDRVGFQEEQLGLVFGRVVSMLLLHLLKLAAVDAVISIILLHIGAITAFRKRFKELREASLKEVRLRIEQFWVNFFINSSIKFSHFCPQKWPSLVTKFTMKNENCSLSHLSSNLLQILKESRFKIEWVVNVDSTLNMPGFVFVIKSGINYQVRVALVLNQVCQRLFADWVHVHSICHVVVNLLKHYSTIVCLEKFLFNTKPWLHVSHFLILFS